MENSLLASLNPQLLTPNSIEELNKLKKEDIKHLADTFEHQMKGSNYLSVELFKNEKSQGKMSLNYRALSNRLYTGNSDSFTVYAVKQTNLSVSQTATPKVQANKSIFSEDSKQTKTTKRTVKKTTKATKKTTKEKEDSKVDFVNAKVESTTPPVEEVKKQAPVEEKVDQPKVEETPVDSKVEETKTPKPKDEVKTEDQEHKPKPRK